MFLSFFFSWKDIFSFYSAMVKHTIIIRLLFTCTTGVFEVWSSCRSEPIHSLFVQCLFSFIFRFCAIPPYLSQHIFHPSRFCCTVLSLLVLLYLSFLMAVHGVGEMCFLQIPAGSWRSKHNLSTFLWHRSLPFFFSSLLLLFPGYLIQVFLIFDWDLIIRRQSSGAVGK